MKCPRLLVGSFALLVMLLSGCTTVPETGRRQIIISSPAEEAQQGLTAFAQIKQEEKISDNVMYSDQVTRIGKRIAESVGRDLPHTKWEFVVFESDDINAFALPGGKVGVYTGLIKLVESDDELACVMGHEIAHVSSRHGAERMTAARGAALGGVVTEVASEKSENKEIWRAAYGVGATLGTLKFSRVHESEADAIGLRFAAGAGYDPRAAVVFWKKMAAANEGKAKPPEWLSTHPSDATRIANLEKMVPAFMPRYEAAREHYEAAEMGEGATGATKEIGAP